MESRSALTALIACLQIGGLGLIASALGVAWFSLPNNLPPAYKYMKVKFDFRTVIQAMREYVKSIQRGA